MKETGNKVYALDTNIVIDLFKGQQNIADEMNRARQILLPVPTLGELYLGAEYSSRKAHHLSQIDSLLKLVEVVHTSVHTAEIYGEIKSYLRRSGLPIPENDIWIAALCNEHDLPLVTRDNHFKRIPDLILIDW